MRQNRSHSDQYLREVAQIAGRINADQIERVVDRLILVRRNRGRIFCLGVGGSAANASHAANDFRKIAGFESYAPTDNAAELTARVNDEGWETVFEEWLKVSRLSMNDALFVFSVGGGDERKKVSVNLVRAVRYGRRVGCAVLGVVGREQGFTAKNADACVIVPAVNPKRVTFHTESFQSIVWHLIVSHPKIQIHPSKWESVRGGSQ